MASIAKALPRLTGCGTDGVKDWLAELKEAKLLWHMDDSPLACFDHGFDDGDGLSTESLCAMSYDQGRAIATCEAHCLDIFDLYPPQ